MIFKGMNLCDFCFEPLEPENICKNCGLSNETYKAGNGILPPGTIILGKYIIGRVLGRGTLGTTYLAYSGMLDKVVALKEYYPIGITNRTKGEEKVSIVTDEKRMVFEKGAIRFYEEAKAVERFNTNKNIVSVYECFYANDTVYYSMEYLKGTDLKSYIKSKGGKLSEAEAITIMRGICDALVTIHGSAILHRDIRPQNIFICENGDIKLIDFGAAKQIVMNSPLIDPVIVNHGFTPLEQYRTRGKLGPWTDIYSLGATVCYAVTGKIPMDAINRIEEPEITFDNSLKLSQHFINIIKKCMELKSEDRYRSSIELLKELSELKIPNVILSAVSTNNKFEPSDNFIPCVYGSPDQMFKSSENDKDFVAVDPVVEKNNRGEVLMGMMLPPEIDKEKTLDPPPLAGIPVYIPPKDFDPKDNIMPCVYGSPEQMSGIYGKKKAKNHKIGLFGLLLAFGISICVILLILILLNL